VPSPSINTFSVNIHSFHSNTIFRPSSNTNLLSALKRQDAAALFAEAKSVEAVIWNVAVSSNNSGHADTIHESRKVVPPRQNFYGHSSVPPLFIEKSCLQDGQHPRTHRNYNRPEFHSENRLDGVENERTLSGDLPQRPAGGRGDADTKIPSETLGVTLGWRMRIRECRCIGVGRLTGVCAPGR